MKTTLYIYIVIWLLIALPLILFNIKKMFPIIPLVGRKLNVKVLIVVIIIFFISTAFLFSAYNITLNTRYELAAERYITAHCNYLLGKSDSEEFKSELSPLSTKNEIEAVDIASYGEYASAQKVEYQVSDWIIPKYFKDVEGFENVNIISDENPIYILYQLKINGQKTDYCIRMIRQSDNSWLVDYFGIATDAQYEVGSKRYPKRDIWTVIK